MSSSQTPLQTYDTEILIIGAGLVGSSVAMHLAQQGAGNIRVIDVDLEGTLSSSELNAGGVRATWSQPLNILTSKISIEYFASVAEDVGYRPCGYTWLHTPESLPRALKAREKQRDLGWEVEAWDLAELQKQIPFIDKVDDLAGALFAPKDGLVNPNLLKNHFRAKARSLGVIFDDRTWLRSAEHSNSGIELKCEKYEADLGSDQKNQVLTGEAKIQASPIYKDPSQVSYQAKRVINCAGAWAAKVALILGYGSPAFAVRRQVAIFDSRDIDLTPYGMIVDTSGVYFHPEASNGLAGIAERDEPLGYNFNYDGESYFQEKIWPALYERSSKFERLRHLTGWAGLYEVSPDESAIIGEVESGEFKATGRVFECHSFSGHGVMHSYAAGQALAEKMVKGRYESLDLSRLSGKRFEDGLSMHETLVI